ncbi:MAG: hypothetical protein WB615_15690 [Candidatus Tumulicola sp.]
MISQERDDRPRGRLLLWATLLSLVIHVLLIPLAAWLGSLKLTLLAAKPSERETVVASTAVRIERRPVPQPRVLVRAPSTPSHVTAHPQVAPRSPPVSRRHELAREAPSAAPQPTPQEVKRNQPVSLQQQLAQQERAFSQEIAQIRARNNPLSLASKPSEPAAAYHRTYFDVPGHRDVDAVQVQLIPIRHWFTGAAICYYTRYVAQYTHGGNEEGTIPWPVCYPIDADRIAHPAFVHDVPIPVPPPDYVLPAGAYLTPLLARIYGTRTKP